jgi:hypothetical protein
MAGWLNMTTEHFNEMAKARKTVALVLLAYWTVFVERANHRGFWFLTGVAERLWHDVGDALQAGDKCCFRYSSNFSRGEIETRHDIAANRL